MKNRQDVANSELNGVNSGVNGDVGKDRDDWRSRVAQAREMMEKAEQANAAKTRFLANISHEIRTPISGVLGMNSLLMGSGLDSEQKMYAKAIHSSATSLLKIIDDILDYSRIEAGKMALESIRFDLRTLMEGVATSMAYRAENKNLELSCFVTPDTPSLLQGDPGRLRQILVNLIGNALKFTNDGEISIKVDVESETSDDVVLLFEICDTGIGIPEDKISHLFKPFEQVDGASSRVYGGTGLGLSISRQFVELMGGKISVKSKLGQGSTFFFTVRMLKQPDEISPMLFPKPEHYEKVQNVRVLGVDDNEMNRMILKSHLNAWGFQCDAVENAREALVKLREAAGQNNPYQVVIIDMIMAGMDGKTLGKEIKRDESIQQTQMVMMTSLARRGDLNSIKEVGFDCYLPKPVKQSELYDCLVMLVARAKGRSDVSPGIITRHVVRELRRSNVRILIVDDNRINQQVALNVLKKMGFPADVAENGRIAVDRLKQTKYDLVFMDCQMPEMDGYEATRCIRNPETGVLDPLIPVIAMTANAMKEDRQKCLDCGMDDYMAKPFMPGQMVDLIEKWRPKTSEVATEEHDQLLLLSQASDRKEMAKQVIDDDALIVRFMNDRQLIKLLKTRFLSEMPMMLRMLRSLMDRSDTGELQAHIRKIIAVCDNMMCTQMALAARQFEQALTGSPDMQADSALEEVIETTTNTENLLQLVEQLNKQCDLVCLQIAMSASQEIED